MARPRLLHVFSTFSAGGPQVRFATLANAWGDRFEHIVQASDNRFEARELLEPRVPFRIARDMPPLKGHALPATVWSIGWYLRRLKPDLLLTYNWGAVEVALANRLIGRRPHVHHEDGFGPDEAVQQNPRRARFRRLALPGARTVIVPSRNLERIARQSWGLRQTRYIPNGVRLADFDHEPMPGALPGLHKPPGTLWVGCVGGLRAEKNPRRLVRAFAAAARGLDAHLVLVGEGVERDAIKADAEHLGITARVHMPGFVAHPHTYMAWFDIYAIPSNTEQFPISQVEAMAARLPVMATDVGDVRAILPPLSQPLVSAVGDDEALAVNLRTLLTDKALRNRLGEANRTHVEAHYQLDAVLAAYDGIYSAAMD